MIIAPVPWPIAYILRDLPILIHYNLTYELFNLERYSIKFHDTSSFSFQLEKIILPSVAP